MLGLMERFGYGSLAALQAESAELLQLLNIEAMGKTAEPNGQ